MSRQEFLLVLLIGLLILPVFSSSGQPGDLTADEKNTIEVVKKAKNSVVFITNCLLYTSDAADE